MNDINYLLKQTKILINMIESEIEENNTLNKSSNTRKKKKAEIFLYGYIKMHVKTCPLEECPLQKYLENVGNYNLTYEMHGIKVPMSPDEHFQDINIYILIILKGII